MVERQKLLLLEAAPLLVDGLALVVLWVWGGTAVSTLQTPSGFNAIYLIGAYILMCAGVYLIRKLEPGPGVGAWAEQSPLLARPTRIVLGVVFGLAMMTVLAFQLGYFNSIFIVDTLALGEGESATLFAFAPGAWLGMSLLYTAFLALKVTPTVVWGNGRYPWQALFGLLGVNAMFVFLAIQLKAILALITNPGVIGPVLLTFLAFLLLFAPPRLVYLAKQRGVGGLTFLGLAFASSLWVCLVS